MLGKKKKPKTEQAEAEAPAEGEAGAEGEAAPAKKKGLPVMLIAGAAVVVIAGGGGATAFLMLGKHGPAPAAQKAAKKEVKKADPNKKPDPNGPQVADGPNGVVFYTLPDIVVNMQTADGKPSFLKLKLTLELPDHDTADALDPNLPRLQDMFQTFLRELRPEDLAGSQGGYQLRMEILRRVNLVIAPSKANSVLIEEMLVN